MTEATRKPSFAVTALLVAAGVVLWLGLAVQLLMVAPYARHKFDEYGLMLADLTKLTLAASNWAHLNWWLVVPAVVGAALVWAYLVGWLRHRRGWTATVNLTAAVTVAALLAVHLTLAVSLLLPALKLQAGPRK